MVTDPTNRIRVTMEQMERLIRVLDDLKVSVLPRNPQLFSLMSEAPLDGLDALREELEVHLRQLKLTGRNEQSLAKRMYKAFVTHHSRKSSSGQRIFPKTFRPIRKKFNRPSP